MSLTKQGSVGGMLRVNLNWNAKPGEHGRRVLQAGDGRQPAIDLDLGCLYEFTDGTKGVVQALGNAFRDRHQRATPIIWLDGDDRVRYERGRREPVHRPRPQPRSSGSWCSPSSTRGANWAAADGVVTLFPVGARRSRCASTSTRRRPHVRDRDARERGGELSVRREVRYVGGHRVLDRAYGWGMNWKAGRKYDQCPTRAPWTRRVWPGPSIYAGQS